MERTEMRRRLGAARVGHLATVRPDGTPHVVVCCFALDPDGGDTVWTVVDDKPKTTTTGLQRLRNIEADPRASLLVDHYDDGDWAKLWWVRVDGVAQLQHDAPVPAPLVAKYAQYRARPPSGVVITLRVDRWTGWRASPEKVPENL